MKMFVFDEKEAKILKMALEVFLNILNGKNDASVPVVEALSKRLQEYSEEAFASVHSQGG